MSEANNFVTLICGLFADVKIDVGHGKDDGGSVERIFKLCVAVTTLIGTNLASNILTGIFDACTEFVGCFEEEG